MLDAAPEVLRRAQAYAIDCAPDLLDDKSRRLAEVARQRDLGLGGDLDLSRAHAGQPSGPLPVLCARHDRRPRPYILPPPSVNGNMPHVLSNY